MRIPHWLLIVFFIFAGIVISALTTYLIQGNPQDLKHLEKTPSDVLKKQWVEQDIPLGLTIKIPYKLKNSNKNLFPGLLKKSLNFKGFKEIQGIEIELNSSKISENEPVVLSEKIMESENKLKSQKGLSGFESTFDTLSIDGKKALLETGYFESRNETISFQNLLVSANNWLYQILFIYDSADSVGQKTTNRIINSIRFIK